MQHRYPCTDTPVKREIAEAGDCLAPPMANGYCLTASGL